MSKNLCLLISARPKDLELAQAMASSGGMELSTAAAPAEAASLLSRHSNAVVLWDLDEFGPGGEKNPLCSEAFARIISAHCAQDRVFVLSSFGFSHLVQFKEVYPAGHFILRRSLNDLGHRLLGRVASAGFQADRSPLPLYFPPGSSPEVRDITLTRSSQRSEAVEQVCVALKSSGIAGRLVSLTAQAVDELIMNAIFGAPVDAHGKRLRKNLKRDSDFELEGRSQVRVEHASTGEFTLISVTDHYGSFDDATLAAYAGRDHWGKPYEADTASESASIGIYGMIQSGLSLLYVSKPGALTKAILFIPLIHGYRDFKRGFQFFGVSKEPPQA